MMSSNTNSCQMVSDFKNAESTVVLAVLTFSLMLTFIPRASNSENVWDERKQAWINAGETPIDLPGIEETAAYILQDGTSADEMHVWRINLLINGVWIQVGASFLQNLDEALPIIKASIAAIK